MSDLRKHSSADTPRERLLHAYNRGLFNDCGLFLKLMQSFTPDQVAAELAEENQSSETA